jgi:hypothetical protein
MLSTGAVDSHGNQLMTTVWGYGPNPAGTAVFPGGVTGNCFHTPAFPIAAFVGIPVRVRWINDLVCHTGDSAGASMPLGSFIPYPAAPDTTQSNIQPDTTEHWANPGKQCRNGQSQTDCAGTE